MLVALMASLVLPLAPSAVQSGQVPEAASQANAEVTVVGRRPDEPIEVISPAIDRYLHSLKGRWIGASYVKGGHPFRTWPATVCLKIDGLQDDAEKRFKSGLATRMGGFGLKTSEKCEGRIYIAITRHADSILSQVQSKPSMVGFSSQSGDISELSTVRSPVHWLEVTADHRLQSMTIIVDATKLSEASDDTWLDYIAFVALIAPGNDTRIDGVASIANAFQPGAIASDHWTRLDRAFIASLYEPRQATPLTDTELKRRTLAAYVADTPH